MLRGFVILVALMQTPIVGGCIEVNDDFAYKPMTIGAEMAEENYGQHNTL